MGGRFRPEGRGMDLPASVRRHWRRTGVDLELTAIDFLFDNTAPPRRAGVAAVRPRVNRKG